MLSVWAQLFFLKNYYCTGRSTNVEKITRLLHCNASTQSTPDKIADTQIIECPYCDRLCVSRRIKSPSSIYHIVTYVLISRKRNEKRGFRRRRRRRRRKKMRRRTTRRRKRRKRRRREEKIGRKVESMTRICNICKTVFFPPVIMGPCFPLSCK